MKKSKKYMDVEFLRPAVSGRETQEQQQQNGSGSGESEPEQDLDGGGPLFTIFNTLLDYPQALEAVRAELERKRQKIG